MNKNEIKVTEFVKNASPELYSASIAETGLTNIGKITWNNALESSYEFVTEENREYFLDYFLSFGAWEKEEIDSIDELNALFIQELSATIREHEGYSEEELEKYMEEGIISSCLYHPFQTVDREYYFYIGG